MINIPVYFSVDFGCKGDKGQCALLSDTVDILIFSNPAIVPFFSFKISDEIILKFLRVEIYFVFVFSCIFIFSS